MFRLLFPLILCVVFSDCTRGERPAPPSLRVLTHDSFASKSGLGPILAREFEARCGVPLSYVVVGDSGQILNRLLLDDKRGDASADIALGFDQIHWKSFAPHLISIHEIREPLTPEAARAPRSEGFVPYDTGFFGWMLDEEAWKKTGQQVPARWGELVRLPLGRWLVLEDPRTSTPGFAWLASVREFVPAAARGGFFRALKERTLTLTPGWSQAYGLFLDGKAPLVFSYLTSQAYHREEAPQSKRYRALVIDDAAHLQIEGAGWIGHSKAEKEWGRCFFGVLLGEAVQQALPQKQWMMPARKGVRLPKSFELLPRPSKIIEVGPTVVEEQAWLSEWRASLR